MLDNKLEALRAVVSRRARVEPLNTVTEVFTMSSCDLHLLAACCELPPGVGPCRVEESITQRSGRVRSHERFLDECSECLRHFGGIEVFPDNGQGRFQGESADEDGKAP